MATTALKKSKTDRPTFRRVRKRPRLVPKLCPIHGIPMIVRRTTADARYHYCGEPGCRESAVTLR